MKQIPTISMLAAMASLTMASETVVDVGRVAVNATVRQSVTYKNVSPLNSVMIETIESSCECLRVLDYPSEVAPNSSVEIAYELRPDEPGLYGYELTLMLSGGGTEVFILNVDVPEASVRTPRDGSLYITAGDVLMLDEWPAFADVRSAEAYTQCHIPGAINVPHYFVSTKKYLRGNPLVLVDGGWGDSGLEETVRELKAAGFSQVHILFGGLTAWLAAGGPTEGMLPGLPSLSDVSAADYLRTHEFEDWVSVDLRDAFSSGFPEWISLSYGGAPDSFIDALSALTEHRPVRVLMMDEKGQGYAEIRRALAGWNGAPVFYLREGVQGLEKQQKRFEASAGSRTMTVTSRGGAFAARGAAGFSMPRKKCGSCPN